MSEKRFAGRRVLLTGAASGMGRASALRFGSEGASVMCADVNAEGAAETAAMINAAGGNACECQVDVTDPTQCRALVTAAVDSLGGLDVLGNIAGIGGTTPVEEETPESWVRVMNVNINGLFYLSQAALPHLLESGGNIVNIASNAGLRGQAYMAAYCASKHAVIGLTRTMALEFGRRGIRINAICPGGTKTAFLAGFSLPEGAELELLTRGAYQTEMADASDIAGVVCFVASDDARKMNGSIVAVDGGEVAG